LPRWRPLAVALAVASAVAAVLPAVASATPWAKISGDRVSSIDQGALIQNGPRVLAAWPGGDGTDLATSIETRGFAPTLARPGAGAGAIATVDAGYTSISSRPALVATPTGLRAVYVGTRPDGQTRLFLSDPLAEGVAPVVPAGELIRTRGGVLDALALADGTPLVADDGAGALRIVRGAAADIDAPGSPVQAQLGGNSYNPALAQDAAGGIWVAWYSNAGPAGAGIYLQGVDPATGAPLGSPQAAPLSASPSNNATQRVALVGNTTGAGARVVYAAQSTPTAPLRLVSWSPGEAPTTVARPAELSLNTYVAAARHADGRLWVAWYDNGTTTPSGGTTAGYAATLGNAKGAGGTVVPLGRPPRTVDGRAITVLPQGDNLLVAAVVETGAARAALWATMSPDVLIPNPQTIRSGLATVVAPKRVSIKALRASRTKCVNVRVTSKAASRVQVSIFSGTRSIRLFGQTRVVFTAPGSKVVCVRVPLRAKTFDVRTPTRIAVATKPGARPVRGEKPATLGVRSLRFFN
jgi:hypothetical protein